METLDSLAYTLNHIFLEDRKIRTYQIAETNDSLMVAEPETPYGRKINCICYLGNNGRIIYCNGHL